MTRLSDWRVVAVLMAAVAWLVYGPALNRVFATDQVWYFAELRGEWSLSAGLRHLDYSVTREFWRGDELLFRPVTFAWLAVANWLLSHHHVWWNVATLALHVAVAVSVFRLLTAIYPSSCALPLAVVFLLFEGSMELVVWNHLGGYLLAWWCLAIGLRAMVVRAPWTFAWAFTAGGLAHEAVVPIAAMAAFIWLRTRPHDRTRTQVGLLVSPVLTFVVLYAVHLMRVARIGLIADDGGASSWLAGLVWATRRVVVMAAIWTHDLMLPTMVQLTGSPGERLWRSAATSWTEPVVMLNLVLVVLALACVFVSLSRQGTLRMTPLLWVVGGGIVSYAAIIAIGRPVHWATATTYYAYPFGLLGIVALYTLLDPALLNHRRRAFCLTVFWGCVGLQAFETWTTAQHIGRENRRASDLLQQVGDYVDAHRAEPGFSFRIEPQDAAADPMITLIRGYPDEPGAEVTQRPMTHIVFARYYDEVHAKYVFRPRDVRHD